MDIFNCLNIKWLGFEKSAPQTILYRHRIQNEWFMKLVASTERGRRKRPETTTIQQLYMRHLPFSEETTRDRMSLLSSCVIPPEYKQYYDELPYRRGVLLLSRNNTLNSQPCSLSRTGEQNCNRFSGVIMLLVFRLFIMDTWDNLAIPRIVCRSYFAARL